MLDFFGTRAMEDKLYKIMGNWGSKDLALKDRIFILLFFFFFRKGQTTSRAIGGKAKIVYFFASGSNPFLKTRAWRIFARLYAVLIIVKLSFIRFGCCEILSRFSCTFSVNAHLTKSSTEISLIYIKKLF